LKTGIKLADSHSTRQPSEFAISQQKSKKTLTLIFTIAHGHVRYAAHSSAAHLSTHHSGFTH